MKHLFRSCLLAGLLLAPAVAETYTIDPSHSNVTFRIRHLLSEMEGRFNDFGGTIDFDPAKPEAAKVNLTVQVKSIDTANVKRDDHLRSKDFFEVEAFPQATFVSTSVKRVDEKNLEVSGDFTLHGVTKPMTVKVRIYGPADTAAGKRMGAGTEFKVDRRVFGVNSYADPKALLGDEVTLRVNVEARVK